MARIFGAFKSGVRTAFDPAGRALVRAGVSADAVTLVGTAGVVAGSVAFAARGQLVAATVVITLCALLDVLDGAMARAQGGSSRYGALLDSVMDRVADGAVFGCLAWWLATSGQHVLAAVTLVCLVASQIISYVKARAEGLGFTCNVGIAERMERLILLGIGALLTGFGVPWGLPAALWLLLVLTVVTVVQRIVHVRREERRATLDSGASA
ncbi:MAG TPA: CDP-alcohol phosphatidyltransferase family protein [Micromonosporaceae bacterium]|nr:CDP-alcohol phosphatidyltransferase family protein [Micromonosporaceae bacterium]